MNKVALTDFQIFILFQSINDWNRKNKSSKEPFLDVEFFKKLFAYTSALKSTLEAIEASQISLPDLYKNKTTYDYNLPLLNEDEFTRLVDGVDTYEIFGWVTEGKRAINKVMEVSVEETTV